MNIQILNLVMQGVMAVGLMLMLLLLVLPMIKGNQNNATSVRGLSVLEIKESLIATQRFTIARANMLLEQSNDAAIEVVAVGKGVNLVLLDSPHKLEIQSLMDKGVTFTVCERSLESLAGKLGHSLGVLPGVHKTKNGHHYAEQLKDSGYVDEFA